MRHVAAVVALGVLGIPVAVELAPAQAQPGRRICIFSDSGDDAEGLQKYGGNHIMAVMDYEKDGSCPHVEEEDWKNASYLRNLVRNNFPGKVTCEELFGYWQTNPFSQSGEGDICKSMTNDVLYVTTKKSDGTISKFAAGEARRYNNSSDERYVELYETPAGVPK